MRAKAERRPEQAGAAATLLAFACAGGWALVIATGYFLSLNGGAAHIPMFMAFAAAALGPIVLILFSALAARDAARANARIARVAAVTESAAIAPDAGAIQGTRELAAALRAEVAALDGIVQVAAKRLDAFETGLRQDGGVLARALAEDVATIGRVRADMNEQTIAVSEAIARHVALLKETTAHVVEEHAHSAAALGAQLEAFGAVSAKIGERSAEFAAAAAQSAGSADKLDAAVNKALSALAHATALTDTARKSAAKPAGAAQKLTRVFSGPAKPENVMPPDEAPHGAEVLAIKSAAPLVAANSNAADLAAIVSDSGVWVADALSAHALARIAEAAAGGPDARREAVRFAAPQALRKISTHLRRDARARRDAEILRREPTRALGAPRESAIRRRELASAYLLIDAVLG